MNPLGIIIDELTRSIRNRTSGDVFDTEVKRIGPSDHELLGTGWSFDWIEEMTLCEVYKLTIKDNPTIIQGLIGVNDKGDHIFIELIESASFNIGTNKVYEGVAGNLFAYACALSFERGYDGYVAFIAKSNLVRHYQQMLGAERVGTSLLMFIDMARARRLVEQYYPMNGGE